MKHLTGDNVRYANLEVNKHVESLCVYKNQKKERPLIETFDKFYERCQK